MLEVPPLNWFGGQIPCPRTVAESMLDLSEAAFYIKLIKLLNFIPTARQRGFSRAAQVLAITVGTRSKSVPSLRLGIA
jgi:hypothetical protein